AADDGGAEQYRYRDEVVQGLPAGVEDHCRDGEDRQLPERQTIKHFVRGIHICGHSRPDHFLVAAFAGGHRTTARTPRPGVGSRRVSCWTTTTRTTMPRKLVLRVPVVA